MRVLYDFASYKKFPNPVDIDLADQKIIKSLHTIENGDWVITDSSDSLKFTIFR